MFGLRQQIQCNPVRVIVAIRNHQYLGRACDHINANFTKHTTLGRCHKRISRPCNFINRRDRFGAIGKRGNRLRTANTVNFVDPRNTCGHHHQRIAHSVRRWHHNRQTAHPCYFCRNRIHQYRTGIRRQTTWHVKPRRRHRCPTPSQRSTHLVGPHRIFGHLAHMIGTDTFRSQLKCCTIRGTDQGTLGLNLLGGIPHRLRS